MKGSTGANTGTIIYTRKRKKKKKNKKWNKRKREEISKAKKQRNLDNAVKENEKMIRLIEEGYTYRAGGSK